MGRRAAVTACLLGVLAACSPSGTPGQVSAVPDVVVAPQSLPFVAGEGKQLPPPPVAQPASAAPMFVSTVTEITPELAARMTSTWRPGCPVPLAELRYVTVRYIDFEGQVRTGELVVNQDAADAMVQVFTTLFAERYPIRQMRLMDDFDGDVNAGLAADNTSAFNCRTTLLGTIWSEHAYGRAIDVNPLENPYWHAGSNFVAPTAGRPYVERPDEPSVIQDGDVVVQAFAAVGWKWGGDWTRTVDWMHFSPSGK